MDRAFVAATLIVVLASWAPHLPTVAEAQVPPEDASAPAKFSADQIDQMVAPVALYPDALLAQILIASTYPIEIVEADRWCRKNASLKGEALDKALEEEDWDPSIKGLTMMPDLLKRMSDNLDWTKDLGDAFLAQQDDVMNAVQAMRRKASEAGNLKTSEQQTVVKEVINNKETIIIQPANPQIVYVPTYPPTVYGPTYAPVTPYYAAPVYGYTPGQMAMTSMLSFGTGVAVGAMVSNGFGWGHNDVHINNNYYGGGRGGGGNKNNVNVNVNKNKVNNWQHNPQHRRNVGYRDNSTQKKFDSRNPNAARNRQVREQARGFDRGDAGKRGGQGGAARGDRGGGRSRAPQGGQGGGRAQTRPTSTGKSGAFGDYGNGKSSRQASQRGASSRGGQSWAGAGGGGGGRGGGAQRGGAQRGGGGKRGGGGGRRGGGGGRRR